MPNELMTVENVPKTDLTKNIGKVNVKNILSDKLKTEPRVRIQHALLDKHKRDEGILENFNC
jgi:hypothetical protein